MSTDGSKKDDNGKDGKWGILFGVERRGNSGDDEDDSDLVSLWSPRFRFTGGKYFPDGIIPKSDPNSGIIECFPEAVPVSEKQFQEFKRNREIARFLQEVIASSSPELVSFWEGMKIQSTGRMGMNSWKRALQRKLGTEAPLLLITPSYTSFGDKLYAEIEVRYATGGDIDHFFAYDGFLETYNLYLESHGYVISSYPEGYGNYVCINLNKKEEALDLSPYPLYFGNLVFQNRTELDAWLSTRS